MMNYKKLIEIKKSVRHYKKDFIDGKQLDIIKQYLQDCRKLTDEIEINIKIMNNSDVFEKLDKIAGYNGFMINSPNYIIILSEIKEHYIENSGYIGEEISLKAKEIGIDSCWITFDNSNVIKNKLNINSDKDVTGIIALGYAEKENSTVVIEATQTEKENDYYKKASIEYASGKNPSKLGINEIVYIDDWGNGADIEILEERAMLDPFLYAVMAPSSLNRQPWRFILDSEKVILIVRNDEYINSYEQKIDAGIVMLYFEMIVSTTLFDLRWKFEKPEKNYNIPKEYMIMAYCNI